MCLAFIIASLPSEDSLVSIMGQEKVKKNYHHNFKPEFETFDRKFFLAKI